MFFLLVLLAFLAATSALARHVLLLVEATSQALLADTCRFSTLLAGLARFLVA